MHANLGAGRDRPERAGLEERWQLSSRWRCLLGALAIAGLAIVGYLPSLSGSFIWDDAIYLVKNPLIAADDGLSKFWCTLEAIDYYPVSNSSLWLEWRLWGENPLGYRVTNLVLHIAAGLLIWKILRTLEIPGAFLAAALFTVHPVNVESVAWITQRKDVLALLFFLLSVQWYLRAEKRRETRIAAVAGGVSAEHQPSAIPRSAVWYTLSLAAFVLAMLSKGSVAILPLTLLLIVWWRNGRIVRGDFARTAPFFLVAAALIVVGALSHTVALSSGRSALARLLGAATAVWFYLAKAFAPIELAFVYPKWRVVSNAIGWWLPLLAAIVLTVALLGRRMLVRSRWARSSFFAWAFFCVALLPALGFLDTGFTQYSLVADHYQHIGLIAVTTLAAAGWSLWRTRAALSGRRAALAAAIVAVAGLTFLTWQQSSLYRDPLRLFQATLRINPDCWLAHSNVAAELLKRGHPQAAIDHYQQLLKIEPNFVDAYYNMGVAHLELGQPNEAIADFQRAIELRPNHPEAHYNLGNALFAVNRPQEAVEQFRLAVEERPDLSAAHYNLAKLLQQLGQTQEAITQLQRTIEIRPEFAKARFELGNLLAQSGQFDAAAEQFRQASLRKPDWFEAHFNLGVVLMSAGRPQEALQPLLRAVQLQPRDDVARFQLAQALAELNRAEDALAAARSALGIANSTGNAALAQQISDWIRQHGSE